jgi:RNA polymerase sigma-70 factor (ECF subfamily)
VPALSSPIVEVESPESRNLVEQARTGDADIFCQICRLYETRLLRQAFTLCGNESLAEDLAQETLVEAWKSLRRFQGRCQFFTWLCAILLNRYRNMVRKKRPVPVSSLSSSDKEQFALHLDLATDAEATPDRTAQTEEEARLMLACIQALPPKHEQVVYLRFYVNHSLEEIAAALGCSVGTVKSRLFRALEKLRTIHLRHTRLPHSEDPIPRS